MSAEIKPGQIWAWKPGSTSHKEGTEVLITSVGDADSPDDRGVWYEYPDGSQEPQWRTRDGVLADMVFVRDATPTPLDPSRVKAGDTVTLRVGAGDLPTLTIAGLTHKTINGVYLGGWRINRLPDYVTLTAHQPAPEPEPEWDGFGSGVVEGERVSGYVSPTGYFYSPDVESPRGRSEVTDFRPLALIDPAAGWWAEIHNALVAAGIGNAGSAASIALRTLGIEATS